MTAPRWRLGVDVGGTFTDFALLTDGALRTHKRLSTPHRPEEAILAGLVDLGLAAPLELIHGSTVATNALLERRGAPTALITTAGFADVIEIGRQNRPDLYALHVQRPAPLVPRAWRFEVAERVDYRGEVILPLTDTALEAVVEAVTKAPVEAVAIALLFSFLRPEHERRLAAALAARAPDLFCSISSEVLPEFREYERTSTTAINAYVGPLMQGYLERLAAQTPGTLRVMLSHGGSAAAREAARLPVQTILSGPAGGVVGAWQVAQQAGFAQIISLDMGGTSTDVSLCPGTIPRSHETEIAGWPVRVPVLDIHTVGAGGGSLGWRDAGGALAVGPRSAGADPGPACYGKGTQATLTDAHVVLGRLAPDHFLGGRMPLYPARARAALAALGETLGLDLLETARGMLRLAEAHMAGAIRHISIERGYDPRAFTLVAFGGAGPLHAVALAEALGMTRVLIPAHPGVLSALGMVLSDAVREYARTVMQPLTETVNLAAWFAPLAAQARQDLARDGFPDARIQLEWSLDLRYVGQSYELNLPLERPDPPASSVAAGFHALHQQRYGFARPEAAIEVVTPRLRAIGRVECPQLVPQPDAGPSPAAAYLGQQEVYFDRPRPTALYDRARLGAGNRIPGPAIIYQLDTTTVIPPGWEATVDPWENLLLQPQT